MRHCAFAFKLFFTELFPHTFDQKVFIWAATEKENGTVVSINCEPGINLERGEFTTLDITENAIHISADAPVYAYQCSNFLYELESTVLQPVNCSGRQQVNLCRMFPEVFFIQILSQEQNIDITSSSNGDILFDNIEWTPVTGTESSLNNQPWYSAVISIPYELMPSVENLSITSSNPDALFQVYSLEYTTQGALFNNYNSNYRPRIIGRTQLCTGEEVTLSTTLYHSI